MKEIPNGWVRVSQNLIECPKSGDVMEYVVGFGWVMI